MKCPKLKELPAPPRGKTGWPWTEESPRVPDKTPEGRPWPQISIVTPNLNFGRFLEKTIRSLLLQGYPDFELIVIDGKSTDNSSEIIKKYDPWITYWVSEPDNSHSQAINKGFDRANGSILNWLCSDDILYPGTFAKVASEYTSDIKLIVGDTQLVDVSGKLVELWKPCFNVPEHNFMAHVRVPQASGFVCNQRPPKLCENFKYANDWGFYLKILRTAKQEEVCVIKEPLSEALYHAGSKSTNWKKVCKEILETRKEFARELPLFKKIPIFLNLRKEEDLWDLYELLENDKVNLKDLLRSGLKRPLLLASRPFWGGMKKSALRQISKKT